jgi:hypothetical protein
MIALVRSTLAEQEACVASAKELTPMDAHLVEASAGIRCAPYSRGLIKPATDFS